MQEYLPTNKRYLFAATLFLLYRNRFFTFDALKYYLLDIPYIKNKLLQNAIVLEKSLETNYKNITHIPQKGLSLREVLEKTDIVKNDKDTSHISGIIYSDNDHHLNNMSAVFRKFAITNPLHPDIFPEIREMEIDIIQMVSTLFKGNKDVCGNVTSGGTESILLAMYTYREWGRKKYGITRPNIVAFHSVHPAFDKACHYFNIKLKKVSSLFWMKTAIDWNTICVVGSSPTYAYGIIDPIEEMASHCHLRNVPLHVDSCMGGFLLPFLSDNKINFNIPGVTSISADSHKYGNCVKGSSVLLFRNWQYKQYQHFIKSDWEGGIYVTPTILGSKSGALIATTWASLLLTGGQKYAKIAYTIKCNVEKIYEEFKNNDYIEVIGEPKLNIIAFKSRCKTINIYNIVSNMKKWDLSVLTNPAAFHFCITSVHTDKVIEDFIFDLHKAINLTLENPENQLEGTLAVYGSAAKIENSFFVSDIVNQYVGLLSSKNILGICN